MPAKSGVHLLAPAFFIAAIALGALRLTVSLISNAGSLQFLSGAVQLGAAAAELPPSGHPRASVWAATAAIAAGDWEAALRVVENDMEAADDYSLSIAAQTYEAAGDFSRAIAAWEQAGNIDRLLALAQAAVGNGQVDTAETAFRAAWSLDAIRTTSQWAGFLKNQGRLAEAVNLYQDALERTRGIVRERAYWYREMAVLLGNLGDWPAAAAAWEMALANAHLFYSGEANLPAAYSELAWAYLMSGDLTRAAGAITQAVALEPSAHNLTRAGWIFEQAGRLNEALAFYRQALTINPNDSTALEAVARLAADQ